MTEGGKGVAINKLRKDGLGGGVSFYFGCILGFDKRHGFISGFGLNW